MKTVSRIHQGAALILVATLHGCASTNPLSVDALQEASMRKAVAECEYETGGAATDIYHACMRAKGAE